MNNIQGLNRRLFNTILSLAIIASVLCIVGNIFCGLPLYLNYKWLLIMIISFLLKWQLAKAKNIDLVKLLFFIVVILVFIPYGYLQSGGSANNAIAYIFLVMICVAFFFSGKKRLALLFMLIATFAILHIIEYYYPHILHVHSSKSQFLDQLFQVPLTLVVGFILLKQFADAYVSERTMLEKYSLELKKANKELDYMANHDSLTGMFNRRYFDNKFDEIFTKKLYKNKSICIVLLDLDSFKHFNDTYGHKVGDTIIRKLSKVAQKTMPHNTIISRWGGDEFAMIVFCSITQLTIHVKELYNLVALNENDLFQTATISMGITVIKENDSKYEVFKRADIALYNSKSQGKNQYNIL